MKQLLIVMLFLTGCGKSYLEVKPSNRQRIPSSLADFQAILDRNNMMNTHSSHMLGIIGGDEFFVKEAQWNTFPTGYRYDFQRNAYIWATQVYIGTEGGNLAPTDFHTAYQRIMACNIVLNGLRELRLSGSEREQMEWTRGDALFRRASDYYNLAQLYCEVYDETNLQRARGLPLRLDSDPLAKLERASLEQVYNQVISDLSEAVRLLPMMPSVKFRPSALGAHALLARVYLQMGHYRESELHASAAIAMQPNLLNYNYLDEKKEYPFPLHGEENIEVLFTTTAYQALIYGNTFFHADTTLLASYGEGDLRKSVYFKEDNVGNIQYIGSYSGNRLPFTGLAIDEVYLTRAECLVRLGRIEEALQDLNRLRSHRYSPEYFERLQSESASQVLDWVLKERRLELVMRGVRWEDLRRLNKEQRFVQGLKRVLGEEVFELPVGDKRWVWPLPPGAIQLGGYPQNDR